VPDICLILEVHQPFRLNHNFHADTLNRPIVKKNDLFNHELNRYVFERAAGKCYFPTNKIILEQIDMDASALGACVQKLKELGYVEPIEIGGVEKYHLTQIGIIKVLILYS